MVAVGRPATARVEPSSRIAAELPALLLVLTPIALLNVLVGTRAAGPPGPHEADAVVTASIGLPVLDAADIGFLGQLGLAQAVAGAGWDSSLLQSARGLCLLAGLLSAAMLWPVLRRLELSGNAAATAVIVAGLGPLALRLQPTVDPGALAGCWITLAAAVGFRGRSRTAGKVAVALLLAAAVITSSLATAGLLAFAAYALLTGTSARPMPRSVRRPLAILTALAALALVAHVGQGAGVAPPGASGTPTSTLVVILVPAVLVTVRGWQRRPELRGVVAMIGVWLACAIVPGPGRLTALLLVVPALALLVGALLEDTPAHQTSRFSIAAATAVTVALVSSMVTVLWPAVPQASSSYAPLAGWLTGELEENVVLSAAPLDRAELVAAGVPASRFAAASVPEGAVTVVPAEAGCGQIGSPVVQMASVTGVLSVCAPRAPGAVPTAGTGPLLAGNTSVRIAEQALSLLSADRVDSRLVAVLSGAAITHSVDVVDFPAPRGEAPDAARRTAVLTGVVAAVDVDGRPAASSLELYLNAQRPPFRPDVRTLPDGRLVVHFRLPVAGPVPPG